MKKEIRGLTDEQVVASREKHGDNSLVKEKSKSLVRRFFENLNDPIIKVLIFALIIEIVFTFGKCNYFEIGGIVAAILIATTVSTVSEYGSEKAFEKMQSEAAYAGVRVLRNGRICEIPIEDIVVGDYIHLSAGEKISADGFIINGSLKVDQSALNGESAEVSKISADSKGILELSDKSAVFRGSLIVSGEAVMRVERVGGDTYYGMVARDVQTETRESPLKLRLASFASQISKIGYVMAAIVAFTYLFNSIIVDNGFVASKIISSLKDLNFLFSCLIHALTLMITIVVVAAPEGLPMMITVVLSANMKRMMRDGVLVKKMVGIETAGSMNILFTDKTGTLTVGKPQCDRIISQDSSYKSVGALKKNPLLYRILCMSARYNTDSVISGKQVMGGNGTDKAILEYFKSEELPKAEILKKQPFRSENKYSTVTFSDGMTVIKGAPEIIISHCTHAIADNGEICVFNRKAAELEYTNAAGVGSRVIAIACKFPGESAIVYVSMIILKDKIRRGVREAVSGMKRAGVHIVMLTGDGKATAEAIAKECGIMNGSSGELVITSKELSEMSDDEVKSIIPNMRVLARALPQDKSRLVRLSQELDYVVGMTGDGINDAPSLKLADVGFAMGNGAEIAKSAGDIVLLDNSIFSINRTVLYGRTIFKSIRKFITFQLMMNLTACGVSVIGQFLGIDNPITIIQMLWVNIIMDTLGGLAFSGEPALEHYMKEKPKSRTEKILSGQMLNQIVFTGGYTLLMCIAFLRSSLLRTAFFGECNNATLMSAFYALFIFAGIFNCFGARCENMWIFSHITRNKPFAVIMLFISAIQIVMIYCGGSLFRTVPLTLKQLTSVILIALSVILFEMIRRVFYSLRRRVEA